MLLVWKGRGILAPIFLIVLMIIAYKLTYFLDDNVGGWFTEENILVLAISLAFIISGVLTYKVSLTYIEENGVKIKVKSPHSFLFIPLKAWSIIKYIIGGLLLIMSTYIIYLENFTK